MLAEWGSRCRVSGLQRRWRLNSNTALSTTFQAEWPLLCCCSCRCFYLFVFTSHTLIQQMVTDWLPFTFLDLVLCPGPHYRIRRVSLWAVLSSPINWELVMRIKCGDVYKVSNIVPGTHRGLINHSDHKSRDDHSYWCTARWTEDFTQSRTVLCTGGIKAAV